MAGRKSLRRIKLSKLVDWFLGLKEIAPRGKRGAGRFGNEISNRSIGNNPQKVK
jgi:hypothetical protein